MSEPWSLQPKWRGARQWDPNDFEEEAVFWPRTFWVDPGVVTGCCVMWFDPVVLLDPARRLMHGLLAWQAWQISGPENNQVKQLCKVISSLGGDEALSVGVESFVIRQMNMGADFLSPVRIRAALEFAAFSGIKDWSGQKRHYSVQTQSPSDAKNVVTDGRLREWQLWTPGPDHARDATRHAMLHLRKLRADVQKKGDAPFEKLYGPWQEAWDTYSRESGVPDVG